MIRFISGTILLFLLASMLTAADSPEIAGWEKDSEVSVYQPDNLWEIIDGAAELFLSYGFQELRAFDIKQDSLIMTVHVYDMETPLNAFGVFRTEKPSDSPGLSIGGEAVALAPYQALLLKDRYYVKVDAYEGDITETVGESLLRAISTALPGKDGLPQEIAFLPEKNKIPNSEGYIRENFLGLEYLNRCLFANYQIGDNPVQAFLALPGDQQSPEDLWIALSQTWTIHEYHGQSVLVCEIPYQGFAGVIRKETGLFGVSHMETLQILFDALGKIVY